MPREHDAIRLLTALRPQSAFEPDRALLERIVTRTGAAPAPAPAATAARRGRPRSVRVRARRTAAERAGVPVAPARPRRPGGRRPRGHQAQRPGRHLPLHDDADLPRPPRDGRRVLAHRRRDADPRGVSERRRARLRLPGPQGRGVQRPAQPDHRVHRSGLLRRAPDHAREPARRRSQQHQRPRGPAGLGPPRRSADARGAPTPPCAAFPSTPCASTTGTTAPPCSRSSTSTGTRSCRFA